MDNNILYVKWKDNVHLPEKLLIGKNTLKYFTLEASYKTGSFDPNYFMEIIAQHVAFSYYANPRTISILLTEPSNLYLTYENTKNLSIDRNEEQHR